MLELLKPRARRLDEFVGLVRYFLTDDLEYDQAAVEKHLHVAGMPDHLRALDEAWRGLETTDPASLEAALRALAEARGVKAGALIHAVRVAVTGRAVSPGLFEVVSLIGRTRCSRRIAAVLAGL